MKSDVSGNPLEQDGQQRLDTWLWASRFYKTRKVSVDAIKNGRVTVNGQRAKPACLIGLNDELRIKRYQQEFSVVVTGLSDKRLGAPLAVNLYCETRESIESRIQQESLLKNQRAGLRFDDKRPGKRDRHKMVQVKNQIPDWD